MAISSYTTSNQNLVVASNVSSRSSAGDYGVWDGLIGFALNKFPNDRKFYRC